MAVISSEHEIWRIADAYGELDDWLPYAEDLIEEWAGQNENQVRFMNPFAIILASYLLMDDLLPASARKAFAKLVLDAFDQSKEAKGDLTIRKKHKARPGRKKDAMRANGSRLLKVKQLIKEGHKITDAYDLVAKELHKSPDTVRRDYERAIKKIKQNKKGEIDK